MASAPPFASPPPLPVVTTVNRHSGATVGLDSVMQGRQHRTTNGSETITVSERQTRALRRAAYTEIWKDLTGNSFNLNDVDAMYTDDLQLSTKTIAENYPDLRAVQQETWRLAHDNAYAERILQHLKAGELITTKQRAFIVRQAIDQGYSSALFTLFLQLHGFRDLRHYLELTKQKPEDEAISRLQLDATGRSRFDMEQVAFMESVRDGTYTESSFQEQDFFERQGNKAKEWLKDYKKEATGFMETLRRGTSKQILQSSAKLAAPLLTGFGIASGHAGAVIGANIASTATKKLVEHVTFDRTLQAPLESKIDDKNSSKIDFRTQLNTDVLGRFNDLLESMNGWVQTNATTIKNQPLDPYIQQGVEVVSGGNLDVLNKALESMRGTAVNNLRKETTDKGIDQGTVRRLHDLRKKTDVQKALIGGAAAFAGGMVGNFAQYATDLYRTTSQLGHSSPTDLISADFDGDGTRHMVQNLQGEHAQGVWLPEGRSDWFFPLNGQADEAMTRGLVNQLSYDTSSPYTIYHVLSTDFLENMRQHWLGALLHGADTSLVIGSAVALEQMCFRIFGTPPPHTLTQLAQKTIRQFVDSSHAVHPDNETAEAIADTKRAQEQAVTDKAAAEAKEKADREAAEKLEYESKASERFKEAFKEGSSWSVKVRIHPLFPVFQERRYYVTSLEPGGLRVEDSNGKVTHRVNPDAVLYKEVLVAYQQGRATSIDLVQEKESDTKAEEALRKALLSSGSTVYKKLESFVGGNWKEAQEVEQEAFLCVLKGDALSSPQISALVEKNIELDKQWRLYDETLAEFISPSTSPPGPGHLPKPSIKPTPPTEPRSTIRFVVNQATSSSKLTLNQSKRIAEALTYTYTNRHGVKIPTMLVDPVASVHVVPGAVNIPTDIVINGLQAIARVNRVNRITNVNAL